MKSKCQALCFPIGAALTGAIAWCGWMPSITLSILIPIAVSLKKSRRSASLTALGYYAGASWPLMPGAKAFFAANTTWLDAAALWFASSFLLALPFGVFWTHSARLRPFGTALALITVSVPPIGIVGWASPLTAAGVLFPGTAWLGLAATLLVCSLFGLCPRLISASAAVLLVIAHASYQKPIPPAGWQAIDTKFGNNSGPIQTFRTSEEIQRLVRESDSKVLIFPEMVINRWNDAARAFWEPTLAYLRQTDKTVLIGAGISVPGPGRLYLNSVLILGSHSGLPFAQRIPVPIAMWKPHQPKVGVPLRLLGAGTAMIAGKRSAILICYEQLLVWPILVSAAEHPDVLVGLSNEYWSQNRSIPNMQMTCIEAWARLLAIPCLSSFNS